MASTPSLILVAKLLAVFASAPMAVGWSAPVDPERLSPLWRLAERPVPRGLGLSPRASGCAVIAFTIAADGKPRDLEVVASHPDARFGGAAKALIEARRYVPGDGNPAARAIATFEILSFGQRRPRTGSRIGASIDPAVFAPCDLDAGEVAARLAARAAD